MALNVTKILFRRGTDAQRLTVNFDIGEPAYAYDTSRLFIGDGQTFGGKPLGMKNLGYVASLTGTYLSTGLSQTAFNAITANSAQIGDIIYDRQTTYLWSITSTSSTPALSNFAVYAVFPAIDTSNFIYSGVNLTLNTSSILPKHISTTCLDGTYFTGGNTTPTPTPITLIPNSVSDSRLAKMLSNSVKVNATTASDNPTNLQIQTTCTVLGRGTGNIAPIALVGANDVSVTASGNTITFNSTPALKLAGGTMSGNINLGANKITKTIASTPTQDDTSDQTQLVNKYYVDNIPAVINAQLIYNYVNSTFLPLAGGTVTGNLIINGAGLYITGGSGGRLAYSGGGPDINFGYPSRGSAITNRAFVADLNNVLTLNYNSDFINGVRIDSKLNVTGNVGIGSSFTNGNGAPSTPVAMLTLNSGNYAAILLGSNVNGSGWAITKENTNLNDNTGSTASSNSFNIWQGGTYGGAMYNRFRITQTGKTHLEVGGGQVCIGNPVNVSEALNVKGSIYNTNNLYVSMGNLGAGGIVLSDDGDIVDLNDGYCSMRFSAGVRIYSGRGTPNTVTSTTGLISPAGTTPQGIAITLSNGGNITAANNITAGGSIYGSDGGYFGSGGTGAFIGTGFLGFYGDSVNFAIRNRPTDSRYPASQGIYFQPYGGAITHMFIRNTDGNVGIGTGASGYKLEVGGNIALQNWIRTRGTGGWYSEDYGGGWYMGDSTWIRNYGYKQLYISGTDHWFDTSTSYNRAIQITQWSTTAIKDLRYDGQWTDGCGLEIQSGGNGRGGGAAMMMFHMPGKYAVRFGLDTDNKLKVGGYSMGSNSYEILHEGNFTGYFNDRIDSVGVVRNIKDVFSIYYRINSGFYQTSRAFQNLGWPVDTPANLPWYHLISNTHSNTQNYYAMQFAGYFYDSNELYYRATNNDSNTAWNKMYHTGNTSGVAKRQILRPDVKSLSKSFKPSVVDNYKNVLCEPLTNNANLIGGTATIPNEGVNIFQGDGQPTFPAAYVTKAANSLINFRIKFQIGFYNAHGIAHFRFYINGYLVDTFSHSVNGYGDVLVNYEYWHQSYQGAGTNITWELKGRSYGGSNRALIHYARYWDGAYSQNQYVQPIITIEEHVGSNG
jgi:hypothetical protein